MYLDILYFSKKKNNSMIEGICNDFAIEFPNFYLI